MLLIHGTYLENKTKLMSLFGMVVWQQVWDSWFKKKLTCMEPAVAITLLGWKQNKRKVWQQWKNNRRICHIRVQCNLNLVTLKLVTAFDVVTSLQRPFFNSTHKIIRFSDLMTVFAETKFVTKSRLIPGSRQIKDLGQPNILDN